MTLTLPVAIADFPNLIPHSDDMNLWHEVLAFDDTTIRCATTSHLSPTHPLKIDGKLDAVNLIEYGAQSIAIHGGLQAWLQRQGKSDQEASATMGYIASVKKIRFYDFNEETPTLFVQASQLSADETAKLYRFEVTDAEQHTVCEGNVLVMHPHD